MKQVNLLSIIQAYDKLNEPLSTRYFEYFEIKPKKTEIQDLKNFIEEIKDVNNNIENLKNYYFGYNIPQIGKEFDLLRFGSNYNINIELKSKNTGIKIINQLVRNKYYLGFLDTSTHYYTFVSSEKKLYYLNDQDALIEKDFDELVNLLEEQELKEISNVDSLFNPSNYLVSPFNSTERFINSQYFLTNQQEQIKKACINALGYGKATFISISGKAGTGKTLVTFDIAKEFIHNDNKILIIHCGKLNDGHYSLIENYNWEITSIRDYIHYNLDEYEVIIIDETQRIRPPQFDTIINKIKANKIIGIFSFDHLQCLRQTEINNNIEQQIIDKTNAKPYVLTEKIRTNKEIAAFIVSLLDKTKNYKVSNSNNIELNYFKNSKSAKLYVEQLEFEGWKVINYTPSRTGAPYDAYKIFGADSTHEVIGQEYDSVVAVIDSHFYYNENDLSTRGFSYYYHPTKMLSQIMTRTRKKLSVVVVNNEEIMDRCLSILN